MEHTLQRQLAAVQAQNARMEAQVLELTALVRQQIAAPAPATEAGRDLVPAPVALPPAVGITAPVATVQAAHQIVNVQNNILMFPTVPWDGEGPRVRIGTAQIVAAFAENARLREYTGYSDYELADHAVASPYVTELMVDLVRRGHASPEARNVYLNPRRADQVLVHLRSGQWEVRSLADATRLMFDGVAEGIHRVVLSDEERRRLPLEAQNALAIAGMLYEEEPDEYVKRAKAPMMAHLTNTGPAPALPLHN